MNICILCACNDRNGLFFFFQVQYIHKIDFRTTYYLSNNFCIPRYILYIYPRQGNNNVKDVGDGLF